MINHICIKQGKTSPPPIEQKHDTCIITSDSNNTEPINSSNISDDSPGHLQITTTTSSSTASPSSVKLNQNYVEPPNQNNTSKGQNIIDCVSNSIDQKVVNNSNNNELKCDVKTSLYHIESITDSSSEQTDATVINSTNTNNVNSNYVNEKEALLQDAK